MCDDPERESLKVMKDPERESLKVRKDPERGLRKDMN